MKLYDAAVQALADFDEPGVSSNSIRENITQRQAELEAQGVSAVDAKRQASYRVPYGFKILAIQLYTSIRLVGGYHPGRQK